MMGLFRRIRIKRRSCVLFIFSSVLVCGGVTFLALQLLIGAASGVADWLSYKGGCLGSKPYSIENIQTMARVKLPEQVKNLSAESDELQDCVIFVTFEIPAELFPMFLESTFIQPPLVPHNPEILFPKPSGWSFEANRKYLVGEGNRNTEYQKLIVDVSQSNFYRVYLETFLP